MSHDKTAGVARSISHSVMNAVEDFSEELNAKSNEEKFCYLGKRSDESLGKGSQELDEGLLETETEQYFCKDLDMICVQEPCVMCAMALNHSRVSR